MSPNFFYLQDKIRSGKKTLTYRQLYIYQGEIGKIEPFWDTKHKKKVKKKSGKGYKEVKTLLGTGKITDIYFRFKKELTIEECCAEQGRRIPPIPVMWRDLFDVYHTYSYSQLLELRVRVITNAPTTPRLAEALFAILWQIESCLAIIKTSWRMLTKINGGDKPNGIVTRWKWLGEVKDTPSDLRPYLTQPKNTER